MAYNTAAIRELLKATFSDEELVIFCYDCFRQVCDRFGNGMSRLQKIQFLIDYCERNEQFELLLAHIKQINTAQYQIYITSAVSASSPPVTATPTPSLPPRTSDHFTGRTQELEQIIVALNEPEQCRLVALYGIGGIGKTALAREAAAKSLQTGRFHQVVWASAKIEKFEGVGVERISVSDLTLESLLDDIARQCHLSNWVNYSATEKSQSIQALLATQPILVVLDNLETVKDYETVVSSLADLVRGQSKILLTSRFEVKHTNVFAVRLGGLKDYKVEGDDFIEGVAFLREEGRSRGVAAVVEAPEETLLNIHHITGGAPLAMKLVVGQLGRQPLQIVLDSLKNVSIQGQDYEFYRFVFKHSWNLLSLEAKKILVSMSIFEPAIGGPPQVVLRVSEVTESVFYTAMDELITMSLVDFVGSLDQRRYILHPLTHYFILSDIVKQWG